jgi:hypothetical protein
MCFHREAVVSFTPCRRLGAERFAEQRLATQIPRCPSSFMSVARQRDGSLTEDPASLRCHQQVKEFMVSLNRPPQVWKAYLDEIRNEVLLGTGVFSEDEQLRELLQECFDQGDSLNGVVSWGHLEPCRRLNPEAN